ncbi:MAG: glycerophosphodiester phosphodiesterase [Rhodospirillales bacterium]|nr:glycerophosphodiester phosphodiesterase [Rhodospirillales bacterium]
MIKLPRVIGHRGAAAYAPENILGSFAKAAELGASWVEFDVHLARDDVPVVIHDRNLARTVGMNRNIDEVHSSELMHADAGSWFDPYWSDERIPTLAQTLDACLAFGLTPNIEIKDDAGARRATAVAVAAVVRERWPSDRPMPLITSFSLRCLYHARSAGGRFALGLLMNETPRRFWTWHARLLRCQSVHVDPSLVTPRLVGKAKRRGLQLAVYTINESDEAERLLDLGVDSVISDSPDLLDAPTEL